MRQAPLAMTGGLCALALTACGSTSTSTTTVHSLVTSPGVGGYQLHGHKVFGAPGIALHFNYPPAFTLRLARSTRLAGNTTQSTEAAVGIGRYDLLIVSRFPHRPVRVTLGNIARLRPQFDAAISGALGHRVSSHVVTVAGLPALNYPPSPVAGLAARVISRITAVFVADDEYELNCQYTVTHAAIVRAACSEMLATLRLTEFRR